MKKTKNIKITKKKFINFDKKTKNEKYFFVLPVIIISKSYIFEWGINQRIVCIGWLSFLLQINIYNELYLSDVLITKNGLLFLKDVFNEMNVSITDKQALKKFLEDNEYIMKIINTNMNNQSKYMKKLVFSFFEKEKFIKRND